MVALWASFSVPTTREGREEVLGDGLASLSRTAARSQRRETPCEVPAVRWYDAQHAAQGLSDCLTHLRLLGARSWPSESDTWHCEASD